MPLYQPLFQTLNQADIRYVVVGGLAVVLHGYARMTADVDLMLDLNKAETHKAIEVLEIYGMAPRLPVPIEDFASAEKRATWKAEKNMVVFSLWHKQQPMLSVGLFIDNPISFDEIYKRAEIYNIDETPVRVVGIPDLIQLKTLSGRDIDHEDIEQLKNLLASKNE